MAVGLPYVAGERREKRAMLSLPAMEVYWSGSSLAANALIGANLLGALMLGMLVGYERSYNGRAAGMRTYGLVCMASTALTIFVGFAPFWYGGAASQVTPDATRVVQGVVTGVGFLCAGVIVKDGLNVSGLTTAASIWAASAIGVLLGVGLVRGGLAAFASCACCRCRLVHEDRAASCQAAPSSTSPSASGRTPLRSSRSSPRSR